MKSIVRILIGIGLLAVGGVLVALLIATKPEAEKKDEEERSFPVVEVMPVGYGPLQVSLPSQGLVDARRRTQLSAEVGGKVIEVSPKFEAGLAFAEGETLLRIDPADYEAALAQAEANLADARLGLETEKARAEQAIRDWKRLGKKEEASDLSLRKPHLASAEAAIRFAEEGVKKAKRDVQRTEVKAPFAGRLARTEVELGAYLGPGTPVAEIYTTAPWEIRLPLSLDDWAFVQRKGDGGDSVITGEVRFFAKAGNTDHEWSGTVIRSEGEVDQQSRSVYLVTELPGDASDALLQPGMFVEAQITGKTLERVAVIPFKAFVGLDEVAVVDSKNTIRKRQVTVVRRAGDDVLVSDGLEEGERLCLTQLSDMVEGMPVDPQSVERPPVLTGEPGQVTTKP